MQRRCSPLALSTNTTGEAYDESEIRIMLLSRRSFTISDSIGRFANGRRYGFAQIGLSVVSFISIFTQLHVPSWEVVSAKLSWCDRSTCFKLSASSFDRWSGMGKSWFSTQHRSPWITILLSLLQSTSVPKRTFSQRRLSFTTTAKIVVLALSILKVAFTLFTDVYWLQSAAV